MCVCECVCVRERERERESVCVCVCVLCVCAFAAIWNRTQCTWRCRTTQRDAHTPHIAERSTHSETNTTHTHTHIQAPHTTTPQSHHTPTSRIAGQSTSLSSVYWTSSSEARLSSPNPPEGSPPLPGNTSCTALPASTAGFTGLGVSSLMPMKIATIAATMPSL